MSDPSNLTSPTPVIDTRPERKGALLPSVQDYYERYRNPNLFISNNANPFLISPYAPNQISQTTKNTILATDIIKPFTPNRTIEVQGSMMAQAPNYFLAGPNQPLLPNAIYANTYPSPLPLVSAQCEVSPLKGPLFEVGIGVNSEVQFLVTSNAAEFSTNLIAPSGTYSVWVDGNLSTITEHFTTPAAGTPISFQNVLAGTPTVPANFPNTPIGYIPIDVAGIKRYVPYYS